jgi:hypothetical protein
VATDASDHAKVGKIFQIKNSISSKEHVSMTKWHLKKLLFFDVFVLMLEYCQENLQDKKSRFVGSGGGALRRRVLDAEPGPADRNLSNYHNLVQLENAKMQHKRLYCG